MRGEVHKAAETMSSPEIPPSSIESATAESLGQVAEFMAPAAATLSQKDVSAMSISSSTVGPTASKGVFAQVASERQVLLGRSDPAVLEKNPLGSVAISVGSSSSILETAGDSLSAFRALLKSKNPDALRVHAEFARTGDRETFQANVEAVVLASVSPLSQAQPPKPSAAAPIPKEPQPAGTPPRAYTGTPPRASMGSPRVRSPAAGFLFLCSAATERGCLEHSVFGLPASKLEEMLQVPTHS